MKIHLVTYATPRFRHRQIILGASGRLNGVVDTVTSWTQKMLLGAGFEERCMEIRLSERGSGYWAWKPFIIAAKLREVPEGDLVFYCDVGRRFPYKFLDRSLTPFVRWAEENGQSFMPGLRIGWRGQMSVWTKRDAFTLTGLDIPSCHQLDPVQASFSLWRSSPESRDFVESWLEWCAQRELISDDPSICGLSELPDFFEHRHDQALLTLCCEKKNRIAIKMPSDPVSYDSRNPSEVLDHFFGEPMIPPSLTTRFLSLTAFTLGAIESIFRVFIRFGKPAKLHPLAD